LRTGRSWTVTQDEGDLSLDGFIRRVASVIICAANVAEGFRLKDPETIFVKIT
jgi:hypothetical protein